MTNFYTLLTANDITMLVTVFKPAKKLIYALIKMAFNNELDRAGRYRKVYRTHINPAVEWRDEHFIKKYRLTKERLLDLSTDFAPYCRTHGTNVGGGLSHFEQVCLATRYFATGAVFSTIAATQRTSIATVSRCVTNLSDYFYATSNRYIRWPYTLEDKIDISHGFYMHHGRRPMIFGCIDGTHVAIVSPTKPREAVFTNRRGYYSLNCMVVCDWTNRITGFDATFAGSANDAYCFSTSDIFNEAEEGQGWEGFALLGDSGYGLKPYLLTPYFNPNSPRKTAFNNWLSSARSVVERSIGVMKQRWRCLDASGGYLHHDPERCSKIVVSCACLHNMAITDRVPHLDHLDNGRDRFVRRRDAPLQPQDHHPQDEARDEDDARDDYARVHFRNYRR